MARTGATLHTDCLPLQFKFLFCGSLLERVSSGAADAKQTPPAQRSERRAEV